MTPIQSTRLFVYGTLMPGHGNHRRIERYVHAARPGCIQGTLVDLGAVPALVPGDGIVEGVVFEIDRAALEITDRIEGYSPERDDGMYLRKEVIVEFDDGKKTKAWTYEFAEPQRLLDQPRVTSRIVDGIPVFAWSSRP